MYSIVYDMSNNVTKKKDKGPKYHRWNATTEKYEIRKPYQLDHSKTDDKIRIVPSGLKTILIEQNKWQEYLDYFKQKGLEYIELDDTKDIPNISINITRKKRPNSSGLCSNEATFRVSSEEATQNESPLPNSSGERRSPSELVVKKATVPTVPCSNGRNGSPLAKPKKINSFFLLTIYRPSNQSRIVSNFSLPHFCYSCPVPIFLCENLFYRMMPMTWTIMESVVVHWWRWHNLGRDLCRVAYHSLPYCCSH